MKLARALSEVEAKKVQTFVLLGGVFTTLTIWTKLEDPINLPKMFVLVLFGAIVLGLSVPALLNFRNITNKGQQVSLAVIGIFFICLGGFLWYQEEKKKDILNLTIGCSIFILLLGAYFLTMELHKHRNRYSSEKKVVVAWWHWIFILGLIFLGSVSYTVAAYFHLKLEKWTFLKALLIAVPFLLIEYQFSLRGNYYAKKHLMMNVVQITILTMIFYFFNAWLLNHLVLKHPIVWWRELLAFVFILLAFYITTHG